MTASRILTTLNSWFKPAIQRQWADFCRTVSKRKRGCKQSPKNTLTCSIFVGRLSVAHEVCVKKFSSMRKELKLYSIIWDARKCFGCCGTDSVWRWSSWHKCRGRWWWRAFGLWERLGLEMLSSSWWGWDRGYKAPSWATARVLPCYEVERSDERAGSVHLATELVKDSDASSSYVMKCGVFNAGVVLTNALKKARKEVRTAKFKLSKITKAQKDMKKPRTEDVGSLHNYRTEKISSWKIVAVESLKAFRRQREEKVSGKSLNTAECNIVIAQYHRMHAYLQHLVKTREEVQVEPAEDLLKFLELFYKRHKIVETTHPAKVMKLEANVACFTNDL